MRPVTLIGFDSAWMDNPKAPGAICAIELRGDELARFHPPQLVSFAQALAFIEAVRAADGCTLLALDQPTIVPNHTSMRPVERVAASLVSWLGGGVQPSNRGRTGMFCDASPIWRFLTQLGAQEQPEESRSAETGLHLIEVFPALALASIEDAFFGRLAAPRYNPGRRKTFKLTDWQRVSRAIAAAFARLGFAEPERWCLDAALIEKPRKADQDMLDSLICLLIAARWRLGARSESMILGSLDTGYMVLPASPVVRQRLAATALAAGVPAD